MDYNRPPKQLAVFLASIVLFLFVFPFVNQPAVDQLQTGSTLLSKEGREYLVFLAFVGQDPQESAPALEPVPEENLLGTGRPSGAPTPIIDEPETVFTGPVQAIEQAGEIDVAATEAAPAVLDAAVSEALDEEAFFAEDPDSILQEAGLNGGIQEKVEIPNVGDEAPGLNVAGWQEKQAASPGLDLFVQEIANGQEEELRGIYVDGLMALRVVQQPPLEVGFVSMEEGTATQFQTPTEHSNIGLLAHNFLSGRTFHELMPGQEIFLIYGAGRMQPYQVTSQANFQRLTIGDLHSSFLDLETGLTLAAEEVFNRFYKGDHHLTLQTCLEHDGVWNWGVQFIIAKPLN